MDKVKTICYGQAQDWESRWDAVDFFMLGVTSSEGSEQGRYTTILMKLLAGEDICSDEVG